MSVVLGVAIGPKEVRVVRVTSTSSRTREPDYVLERGNLTVCEVLRTVRAITGPSGAAAATPHVTRAR